MESSGTCQVKIQLWGLETVIANINWLTLMVSKHITSISLLSKSLSFYRLFPLAITGQGVGGDLSTGTTVLHNLFDRSFPDIETCAPYHG